MVEQFKVNIIILNWNGSKDTIACLASVNKIVNVPYQLILVDNKSSDDDFNKLNEWCNRTYSLVVSYSQDEAIKGGNDNIENKLLKNDDSILIIKNDDNLGFAGGNNVALRYILSHENTDDYTLLLNNDTVVDPLFLYRLTCFMNEHRTYVACTPQIRYYEPKDKIWSCGGKIKFGNRMSVHRGKTINDVPQEGFDAISFITGCALFFKPDMTGLLSEKFFFGEEDFEFSLRLKSCKQKIACVYDSIVYHKVSQSVASSDNEFNRMFLFYAMRFIDYKNYYSVIVRLLLIGVNLLSALRLLVRKKMSLTRMFSFLLQLIHFVRKHDDVRKEKYIGIMNMTL